MADLEQLLQENPSIRPMEDNPEKLKCILSNHEMPKTVKAVEMYINGKKYKKMYKKLSVDKSSSTSSQKFIFEEYLQYLPLTTKGDKRHCKITNRIINNNPIDICRHISGNRFFRHLERYNKMEAEEEGSYKMPTGRQPKTFGIKARTKMRKKESEGENAEMQDGEDEGDENLEGENEVQEHDENEMADASETHENEDPEAEEDDNQEDEPENQEEEMFIDGQIQTTETVNMVKADIQASSNKRKRKNKQSNQKSGKKSKSSEVSS